MCETTVFEGSFPQPVKKSNPQNEKLKTHGIKGKKKPLN
jgi:hypothetical protein